MRQLIPLIFFLAISTFGFGQKRQNAKTTLEPDKVIQQIAAHYKNSLKENDYQKKRFPRTVNSKGELVSVTSPDWTSGFYPATLWYLFSATKDVQFKEAGKQWLTHLEVEKDNKGTHDLGFMIYCPYGNAIAAGEPSEEYKKVIVTASKSLATRYSPLTKTIRSWDHQPAGHDWKFPVIIDNMMNLEMLFAATRYTGDSSFYKICINHADETMKHHFRESHPNYPAYSTFHVVDYDPVKGGPRWKGTHQGFANLSTWARGQAWGIYGYTVMYRETKNEKYLDQAVKMAQWFVNHKNLPSDKVPFWDFNAPEIPNDTRDASAAAITASALLELSQYVSGAEKQRFLTNAEAMLKSLSSAKYLAPLGTNGNFALMHSTGSKPHNSEVDVPLNYADYYFLEALMRYKMLKAGSNK